MALKIKRSSDDANLSLTPLIDVVFLLLIFFLVTSQFENEERRIDIVLPSATSAAPMIGKVREIIIDIDSNGSIFMGGESMTVETLEGVLTEAVADNPTNQTVVIRADRSAEFQPVVSVMDVCNRTGIIDYSVTTQEGPKS
jgi:biopolymer transport protein ExbD